MNMFQSRINKISKRNFKGKYGLYSFLKERRLLKKCNKIVTNEAGVSKITLGIKDKRNRNIPTKAGKQYFNI